MQQGFIHALVYVMAILVLSAVLTDHAPTAAGIGMMGIGLIFGRYVVNSWKAVALVPLLYLALFSLDYFTQLGMITDPQTEAWYFGLGSALWLTAPLLAGFLLQKLSQYVRRKNSAPI
ncbi:hypothetical protein ACKC9G_17380 [Pokkaliibacter sp. CJK22405]|uniref:hypothetical protein n=1 Tax=Pokkaliibacter sp. CJK22405 TaxID=3384615 RepID=UPI0039855946